MPRPLLIRAALGEDVERPPCWVMRQAGRYLPEYHTIKAGKDFFETCRDPEIASEITVQPIDRYEGLIDAAIIFSDILVIPQALGMRVEMLDKIGPVFPDPIKSPDDIEKLKEVSEDLVYTELGYVSIAIKRTIEKLNGRVPLIGFCGAPWTLMAYMIDRGNSKTFHRPISFLRRYPESSHGLLKKISDIAILYLLAQVDAGCEMIQVFDSWAGELDRAAFLEFALPYLQRISAGVDAGCRERGKVVPKTIFAKGAWFAFEELCESGYEVVGLDWLHDPAEATRIARGRVTLQGNMNPAWLIAGKEVITQEVQRMISGFGGGKKGYIVNLGHGIFPEVDPDDLKHFFEQCHHFGGASENHEF